MKRAAAGLAAALAVAAAVAAPPAGDVRRGERAYQKCYACHSLKAGDTALDAPNLRGNVGRLVARERGVFYTTALKRLARRERRWTPDLLHRFLADPEAVAPGTSMTFTGMPGAQERADLIAYLRTQR